MHFPDTQFVDGAGKSLAVDVLFSYATCTFGSVDLALERGTSMNVLLQSRSPSCVEALDAAAPRGVSLTSGTATLNGVLSSIEGETDRVALSVTGIPSDAPLGTADWTMLNERGSALGKVHLRVVDGPTVETSLDVQYPRGGLGDGPSANGVAVVSPGVETTPPKVTVDTPHGAYSAQLTELPAGPDGKLESIVNIASVTWSPELARVGAGRPLTSEDKLAQPATSTPVGFLWRTLRNPTKDVSLIDCLRSPPTVIAGHVPTAPSSKDGGPKEDPWCWLTNPGHIQFVVGATHGGPIVAPIEVHQVERFGLVDGTSVIGFVEAPILRTSLRITSSARVESVPLPINQRAVVVCNSDGRTGVSDVMADLRAKDPSKATETDTESPPSSASNPFLGMRAGRFKRWDSATDGSLVAINDDAMTQGGCFAVADLRVSTGVGPLRASNDALLHGPQSLTVTVHRDGAAADVTTVWVLRPEDTTSWVFPVSPPTDASKGSGAYHISIVAASGAAASVQYRDAFGVQVPTGLKRPELEFDARLQPRGPYAWRGDCLWLTTCRTFITVPINPFNIRVPASQFDVTSSTTHTRYEFTSPSIGVLVGVEPWDYARQVNPTPMSPRLLTGFQFNKDGSGGDYGLSWLVGISAGFPIVDSAAGSKIPTSASVGLFWEHDLREGGWLSNGHLLVSFSFQVFSFLGNP
ncbi:MAG: hypothetical protein ACHREM_10485 [Polyangiales bacterium]